MILNNFSKTLTSKKLFQKFAPSKSDLFLKHDSVNQIMCIPNFSIVKIKRKVEMNKSSVLGFCFYLSYTFLC